jgi:hypothetical protein
MTTATTTPALLTAFIAYGGRTDSSGHWWPSDHKSLGVYSTREAAEAAAEGALDTPGGRCNGKVETVTVVTVGGETYLLGAPVDYRG